MSTRRRGSWTLFSSREALSKVPEGPVSSKSGCSLVAGSDRGGPKTGPVSSPLGERPEILRNRSPIPAIRLKSPVSLSVAVQRAVDEQVPYRRSQRPGAFQKRIIACVRNGVRTHQVRKVGNSHQPGVRSGRVLENRCDNGRRGDALPFQSNSVVQTARRATPSIANTCDDEIRVAVQVGQHFRVWRQGSAVLASIKDVGELKLIV